jgi:3-oxoacyl-[acyl-carrier-protein] synthase-3
MTTKNNERAFDVGIIGVHAELPRAIRRNDFWSADTVADWGRRLQGIVPRIACYVGDQPGAALALAEMEKLADDPFQGIRERRIADAALLGSDLEASAIGALLRQIGKTPAQVDALVSHPMLADYECVNHASIVQHKAHLRPDTRALTVSAVCASLGFQAEIAEQYIASGRAQLVVASQSSICTRILPLEEPWSAWHGDCSSALAFGPVERGLGLRSFSFYSDGSLAGAFVATVPGKRWWDEGAVVAWSDDKAAARAMQLRVPDLAKVLISRALSDAAIAPDEVAFFACHQPQVWLRRVVQAHAGLDHAKSIDTCSWTGSLSTCNVPLQLYVAHREGMLQKGAPVVLFGMASGLVGSAVVLRWAL